ncbi:hypothetical protein NE237_021373 [Protea cynaroides]|uniref:TF-B3 domain-containing protein n=1 Tax=Protea cynaroides TaxID=273540 RepID=A0A9Q0HB09_9MAGN|nr:hypothetical protein NE237_021373 [Protea cynaroides]
MLELRRSARVRNSVSSYSEEPDIGLATPHKRSRTSSSWESYLGRPANEASDEERACAIRSAEMLQFKLGSKNPSLIKSMVPSHVYNGFWLGLPTKFCKDHLSANVVKMILEDEDGSEYDATYIGSKGGLSGGWRRFALDHKLDDGDALLFEQPEPTRFKIYIVRASNLTQENSINILDKKVNGITIDASLKLNENVGGKVKQEGKAEKATDVGGDEGSASHKRQQNDALNGKSEVQKENNNGTRAASKTRKQKDGFNGEREVKDERIEAEVQKEKMAQKGNRCASPKKQKKAGESGKSEVKQKKIVGNDESSVSVKPQQQDGGNKLPRKRCTETKLFRRKVFF